MDKRIAFLKKQMIFNLQNSLTVKEMAHLVNLSESHLLLLFKRELGTSPLQFLRELRLEKARELLEDSFKSVKEIGCEIGIKDTSHFVRDFKTKYGSAPSEYRKRHWSSLEAQETNRNKSENSLINDDFRQEIIIDGKV